MITEEGIDELAAYCGAGEAVAEWTKKAMDGGILFQDALAARLELIKPSRADVTACLEQHPPQLSPSVLTLFDTLRERGAVVHIVSGGFRAMIEPYAHAHLGVASADVYANTILWDNEGKYLGFDADEPTSREGGKPAVIDLLKRERGYRTVVMVGDGATDLQARPPADAFIGFGGVAERTLVKEGADWYVTDFNLLIKCLKETSPEAATDAPQAAASVNPSFS